MASFNRTILSGKVEAISENKRRLLLVIVRTYTKGQEEKTETTKLPIVAAPDKNFGGLKKGNVVEIEGHLVKHTVKDTGSDRSYDTVLIQADTLNVTS